ncbi:MAG: ATP-binding protein [Anaerolineae bacterium]|nr:ATP-binding protein [Anaerolineae bacterium]
MWLSLRALWVSQGSLAAEAVELLHRTVRHLIFGTCAVFAVCYTIVALTPWWTERVPGGLFVCVCYGAVCLLSLKMLPRKLLAGQVTWLAGLTGVVVLAAVLQREAAILVGLVLVPLLGGLTIGWPAAAVAGAMVAVLVGLPTVALTQLSGLTTAFAVMVTIAGMLGAVLGCIAARGITDVALWSLHGWEQARNILEEARDQKLEMKQVQEDLVLANQELSRLSDKLKEMWEIAQEARQAKAEFVANVSHELRTPLNMIIGFAELMTAAPRIYGRRLPATLLADLGAIHTNARHLASLVDDVLDLSQVEAGRMALSKSWTSLPAIIEEVTRQVGSLYDSKGLGLRIDVQANMPSVYCDATRIRQVLLNLLSNAGRFMEKGDVCVRARCEADTCLVSVTDTGPGIAAEDISRLFQPFSQLDGSIRRSHGGSGLGLSISKQFVEMHGGRMWVESTVGVGTTFIFSLPMEAPVPASTGEPDPVRRSLNPEVQYRMRTRRFRAPLPRSMPRFVVVEKDQMLSRFLGRYMDGVQMETVDDAQELPGLLRDLPASAVLIDGFGQGDLAFLDQEFARIAYAPPVITCWVTGDEMAARDLGIARYLPRPITRQQLLSAVEGIGEHVRTILLVDDDPEVLRLSTRMLLSADRGYRVVRATTGARALHLLRTEQPQLMILDLVMPGMDGLQVLREKTQDPAIRQIPVIVASAKGLSGEPMRIDRIAITSYGGLPVASLLACIQAVTGVTPGAPKQDCPGPGGTPAG